MRALVLLPLLGGCWLGNDFARFEHGDGGPGDLAERDLSASADAGLDASALPDLSLEGDGGEAAGCAHELSWSTSLLTNLPLDSTLVSVPTSGGANRLFIVGGCRTSTGGKCSTFETRIYEVLASSTPGQPVLMERTSNSRISEIDATAVALPSADPVAFVVVGSITPSDELIVVPDDTDMGTTLPSGSKLGMNAPSGLAAALLGTNAVAAGGLVTKPGSTTPQAMTYVKSSVGSDWAQIPMMLTAARGDAAMAVFVDTSPARLWVIGGFDGANPLSSVESLDDPTGPHEWTTEQAHLEVARFDHAAVTAPDGRIYVAGGQTGGSAMTALASVEVTCGARFSKMIAHLEQPLTQVSAGIGPDNRMYVLGKGNNGAATATEFLYAYGPVVTLAGASLSGSGFPIDATVALTDNTNHALGTTTTNGTGLLSYSIANLPKPPFTLYVTDDQSNYPVRIDVPQ